MHSRAIYIITALICALLHFAIELVSLATVLAIINKMHQEVDSVLLNTWLNGSAVSVRVGEQGQVVKLFVP